MPNKFKREPLLDAKTVTISDEIKQLATNAHNVLGYKLIRNLTTNGKESLRLSLITLGIQPFVVKEVEEYRKKMITQGTKNLTAQEKRDGVRVFWKDTSIKFYRKPIPENVLQRAIQIKQAIPEVDLHISFLTQGNPDPFLVASLGSEKYYVDVWDEPAFTDKTLNALASVDVSLRDDEEDDD